MGTLHKTSQSRRDNAVPGPTRHRRFRLTPESLEYFQQFSHVRNSLETSLAFYCQLLFPTHCLFIQHHTKVYKYTVYIHTYTYMYTSQ